MTKNTNQNQNNMSQEFGSETDVNQVRKQNQQSAQQQSHSQNTTIRRIWIRN